MYGLLSAIVHTSSQFSADMARNRAFVPRLENRFFKFKDLLIGLKIVEKVDAVLVFLERDLFMFIIWVDVPAGAYGGPVILVFEIFVLGIWYIVLIDA